MSSASVLACMTAASTLKGQIDENRVASVIVSRFGRMPLRAAEIGVFVK